MNAFRITAAKIIRYRPIVFCIFLLISGYAEPAFLRADPLPASAPGNGNATSARIGIIIDSGAQSIHARGLEKIKPGDRFRIYVQPEEACHIYVVHTDHKTVTLLTTFEARDPGELLALPGASEWYEVDGKSSIEAFTIICSPVKRNDISALFESQVSYERWAPMEVELLKQGKNDLSQKPGKPFPITGNVREFPIGSKDGPLVHGLPTYSGTALLVKRYEFNVKK